MKTKFIFQFFGANLALALAWFGYFSPWVSPIPVALRLSAHDLVEWMTFVQTVRDGTFPVSRLDLSLPWMGVALLAALVPTLIFRQTPKRPYLLNSLYLVLGLFSAFLILPAYPFILTAYNDPELSPQFWLGIVTGLAVCLLTVFVLWRPAWAVWLIPIIALTSIVWAVRAYTLVEPALTDILTKPVPIGYGYIGYLIGVGLFLILPSLLTILKKFERAP